MKFLVLALCVAAASAATFPNVARPWQQASAKASVVTRPVVAAVKEVVIAPFTATAAVAKTVINHGQERDAPILRSESDVGVDKYVYVFETGNGISAQASGELKKVDNTEALVSQGGYKYTAPDGTPVEVTYTADENGFQPQGAILPVSPPIPVAILRALDYIAAHPQPVETKKF